MNTSKIKVFLIVVAAIIIFVSNNSFAAENPDKISAKAMDLFDSGNPRKAVDLMLQGLKNYPKSVELLSELARLYEKTEDIEKAMDALKKALELKPRDQKLVDRIIILNQEIKEKKRLRNFPSFSNPQEQRAMDLLKAAKKERGAGRLHEAFQKFIEAADVFPGILDGKDLGFIVSGLEFYSRRMIMGDKDAIFFHSVFMEYEGDLKGSESGIEKFLTLEPNSPLIEKARIRLVKVKNILYTPPKTDGSESVSLLASTTVGSGTASNGSNSEQLASGVPAIVDSQLEEKIVGDLKSGISDRQLLGIKWAKERKKLSEIVIKALGGCLELGDDEVKAKALDTIARIGPDASILFTEIDSVIRGENKNLRLKAFNAAGAIKLAPNDMIPNLINFFEDPDPEISNSAVKAVSKYGEEAIPLLQEYQEKRESQVSKDRAAMAIYLIRKGE